VANEQFRDKIRDIGPAGFVFERHQVQTSDQPMDYGFSPGVKKGQTLQFMRPDANGDLQPDSFAIPVRRNARDQNGELINGGDITIDHDNWYAIGLTLPDESGRQQYVAAHTSVDGREIDAYKSVDIAETEALRLILAEGEAAAELMIEPIRSVIDDQQTRIWPTRFLSPDSALEFVKDAPQKSETAARLLKELLHIGVDIRAGLESNDVKLAFSRVIDNGSRKFVMAYSQSGGGRFIRGCSINH
jgi:hypothetical protein